MSRALDARRFHRKQPRKSGHVGVKKPPQYYSILARSIFAEWGLNKSEYSSRGVPSKTYGRRWRVRATMSHAQLWETRSRENGMKEATKRAASEALAQMLAVTAMLVIASFVFYVR
jgi:hypothetical protein